MKTYLLINIYQYLTRLKFLQCFTITTNIHFLLILSFVKEFLFLKYSISVSSEIYYRVYSITKVFPFPPISYP